MILLERKMTLKEIIDKDGEDYFPDDGMVKAVADVDRGLLAVNAGLHSDLEELLLDNGSLQSSLYGFNIYHDNEIEYDSLINPPRNREDGFPRGGRDVSSPEKRRAIEEIVNRWIQPC